MKKFLALMVAVLMVAVVLIGCASTAGTSSSAPASAAAPASSEAAAAASSAAPASSVAAAPASSAAASGSSSYNPKDHPIAMNMILKTNPTVQLMIAGFVTEAVKLGYDPYVFAIDGSDDTQAYAALDAGMAQHKIQGLVQYLFDDSAATYVQKYSSQGVYVVTGHTNIADADKSKWPGLTSWVACSAVDYGKEVAETMGKQVNGTGTVAVTEGSFNPTEDAAANSFQTTMASEFPNIKVLKPIEEGFDTPTAIQRATGLMQANSGIVGAFSTTGMGGTTWSGAEDATGKHIVVITMDYNQENLDLIKAGKIYAVVAQPLFQEFAKNVDQLDTLLRGGTVPYANPMPAPLVTTANMNDYYAYLNQVKAAMSEYKS